MVKFDYLVWLRCIPTMLVGMVLITSPKIAAKPAEEWSDSFRLLDYYQNRGDLDRSLDVLSEIYVLHPDADVRLAATIQSAFIYEQLGKSKLSLRLLSEAQSALQAPNIDALRFEISRISLLSGNTQGAKDFYPEKSPVQAREQGSIFAGLDHQTPWFDRPFFYGLSSAIIPGLGQTLAGAPMDGLSSILMISIPAYLAIGAKRNGEHAFAAGSGLIAGIFYLGGISSSVKVQELNEKAADSDRRRRAVGVLYPHIDFTALPMPHISVKW